MSTFLSSADYLAGTKQRILDLILDGSLTALPLAENDARAYITDLLADRYDLTAEFAKTETDRNNSLIMWMRSITLYKLYARIPDEEVPERVIKDYDDTRRDLELIAKGNLGCSLKRIVDSDGEKISRFRMSNNTPRTHDPYSLG